MIFITYKHYAKDIKHLENLILSQAQEYRNIYEDQQRQITLLQMDIATLQNKISNLEEAIKDGWNDQIEPSQNINTADKEYK